MKIGLFGGAAQSGTVDQVIAEAKQAERDGFSSYWMPQIFAHDALTLLALIGREVPRIELGTAVVPTYPRHPMMLAQQCLTVNAAVGGRLCLGIGLSHQIVIENMMGMSFDKPVRHMREYLTVLQSLNKTNNVSFSGEVYSTHAGVSVTGSQPFGVVVAALGEQMLRVTAALADGTLTWCTGPSTLANHTIPVLDRASDALGKPKQRVIAALPVCVTTKVAEARERASQVFAIYGQLPSYRAMLDKEGAAGPADIAIVGTAAEVTDRITALADIGVADFAAVEFGGDPDESANTRAALKTLLS
ncbi:MAG: TIGR03564 family F420-dependent LLM class oxidoreductase [Acidobacteria bacterium]|nr:TIGR03564 family F420-dependent LLM class oxidoreductase [Acidobacteriota bacterium]